MVVACVWLTTGCALFRGPSVEAPAAVVVRAEPISLTLDEHVAARVDELIASADALPIGALAAHERVLRHWLGRLQFEDPLLIPWDADPTTFFRFQRGRVLDALGWSALRRGDLRQAEAALKSAVDEINNRATTSGYARPFLHLGELYLRRGMLNEAIEFLLDAEVRGLGARATPSLEVAWRRRHRSLVGLDAARAGVRARVEDEHLQFVVADAGFEELPQFAWPRRTGPAITRADVVGAPLVIAVWDAACAECDAYAERLAPLAEALRARRGRLLGVYLGADPSAAGPPQRYSIVVPVDARAARRDLGADALPHLLVVDARAWIRYRHGGARAASPPITDVLTQIDHLRR